MSLSSKGVFGCDWFSLKIANCESPDFCLNSMRFSPPFALKIERGDTFAWLSPAFSNKSRNGQMLISSPPPGCQPGLTAVPC